MSFLEPNCGINLTNQDKLITPLHKNIINMNNPTMGFIGFINMTLVHRVFDLQVQYYYVILKTIFVFLFLLAFHDSLNRNFNATTKRILLWSIYP